MVGLADRGLIAEMTRLLAHRGPDGEAVRLFESAAGDVPAALGHRRLSVIDLSDRGSQPMSTADGRYTIVYNGELYNFQELRRDLERDGVRFRSDCDTEVLLEMHARHGPAMLEHLNGMFAFAVWDDLRRSLFIARDRLGIKPLYWAERDGVLFFGSEVKALLPALGPARMREDVLAAYLTFLWVPDPDTLFDGVHKLPPGHCATYADGRLAISEYWDVTFAPKAAARHHWAEELDREIGRCVRRQVVADVPLGSFLSGGIDSSTIVAHATEAQGQLTTYTVGFSAGDLPYEIVPDDVRYSRVIAERFNTDYHERTLQTDIVELLPRLIWHMDEPVADPPVLTTYLICAAARERLTVVLSGMGGDELFAGYPRHQAARLGRIADVLPLRGRSLLRRALAGRVTVGGPGRLRRVRRDWIKWLRGLDASPTERYLIWCSHYRRDELDSLLTPALRDALGAHDPFRRHRAHLERMREEHWLNQLLYLDLKTYLPCQGLAYTDKMSMAASTEVRVPLLDDELVKFATTVPPSLKLHRLTGKYVLKQAMQRRLPKEIVSRPKAGFGAPIRSWLMGDLAPMVEDLLSPAAVRSRGLFDPSEVQRLLDENRLGIEDNAQRLWALLTLELWQRAFIDR